MSNLLPCWGRLLLAAAAWCGLFLSSGRAAEEAARNYDVPAGDAATSFRQFSEVSGREILFAAEVVRGVRTNAVRGEYTSAAALDLMLVNTGLVAERDAQTGAFAVRRRPAPSAPADPPAAPKAAVAPAEEMPVKLSPFEVSATANRGYVTTSSLSASRIAVPITELPSTVITINEQFISDTVALDMRDTLTFVSGASHGGTGGQEQNAISLRGFNITSTQRDGVSDRLLTTYGGFDYALIERLEVVKGPSGVLYGSHSAGGIVNIISKRPLAKPRTLVSTTIGSYNSYRVDLDTSGFLDSARRFGYRLAGVWADTDGPLRFAGEPNKGLFALNPSLSYRGNNGLYVWAWAAYVDDSMKRLMTTAHAYQTGPTSGRTLLSEAERSRGNNIFRNFNNVRSDNYELGFSQTFEWQGITADARLLARWFDLRSSGDRTRAVGTAVDLFLDSSGNVLGTDARTLNYNVAAERLATIARQQIRYDQIRNTDKGAVYTADLSFGFELGPTKHRLMTYATDNRGEGGSGQDIYTITNTAKLVALGAQLVGGQTRIQIWPTPAPEMLAVEPATVLAQADTRSLTSSDGETTSRSYGGIERMSLFQDRLFLVVGLRSDDLETRTKTSLNGVPQPIVVQADKSDTRTYAALVKLYDGPRGILSAYYNNNETFLPVFSLDRRLNLTLGNANPNFGQRFPNRIASNEEYGIKVDMFGSRVVATVSLFETVLTNGLVSFTDIEGVITGVPVSTYQAPVGSQRTRGWDLDLNFVPFRDWEVTFSYAKMNSLISETKLRPAEQPDSTMSGVVRYVVPRGPLRGLSLMWMYSYWGSSLMGSRTNWLLPSGDLHTAVIGYKWKRWNARLRVENVPDRLAVLPSTFETTVNVTKPRNFRFSLSREF